MRAASTVLTLLALSFGPQLAFAAPKSTTSATCRPSWATVDDFLPAGALKASGGELLATSSSIFVVGTTWRDATTSDWVVRKSKAGGSWSTADDFFSGAGISAHPDAIARNTDHFFAVGGANVVGSNVGPWLVRSSPNGTGWTTVDQFDDPNEPAASAHGAVLDGGGHVLVGGFEAKADGSYHWLVRETADGTSWTVSDDVAPTFATTGMNAIAFDEITGTVFAVGYDFDRTQYTWRVRARSAGTWADVDDFGLTPFPASSSVGAVATSVATSGLGAVFVSGFARDPSGVTHWVVRKSSDDGASWSTIDELGDATSNCAAKSIAYDNTNKITYVVGRCFVGGTNYHWLTRVSTDDGATWRTEDDFVFSAGQDSFANGVAAAPDGGVFAAGTARAADGTPHWVVRQRTCK